MHCTYHPEIHLSLEICFADRRVLVRLGLYCSPAPVGARGWEELALLVRRPVFQVRVEGLVPGRRALSGGRLWGSPGGSARPSQTLLLPTPKIGQIAVDRSEVSPEIGAWPVSLYHAC